MLIQTNAAKDGAKVNATATEPTGTHEPEMAVDGSDSKYWASNFNPEEPVAYTVGTILKDIFKLSIHNVLLSRTSWNWNVSSR